MCASLHVQWVHGMHLATFAIYTFFHSSCFYALVSHARTRVNCAAAQIVTFWYKLLWLDWHWERNYLKLFLQLLIFLVRLPERFSIYSYLLYLYELFSFLFPHSPYKFPFNILHKIVFHWVPSYNQIKRKQTILPPST